MSSLRQYTIPANAVNTNIPDRDSPERDSYESRSVGAVNAEEGHRGLHALRSLGSGGNSSVVAGTGTSNRRDSAGGEHGGLGG
jgi:hypothetical protein